MVQTSFWYLESNHSDSYKKRVLEYLDGIAPDIKSLAASFMVVQIGTPNEEKRLLPGSLYITEMGPSFEPNTELLNIFRYVLSRERAFRPVAVSCEVREDYSRMEKILKESHGDKARLTSGLLWIPRMFNTRIIKIPKPKV